MEAIIETKRLILREFTQDDAALIYQLNLDPRVIEYTKDPIRDLKQAKEILTNIILPQYTLYKHGRWAVHTKNDFAFIGWCGLKYIKKRNEIDLGYRFMHAAWGKGFATEAALQCIDYGFRQLRIPKIIGRAMPENTASIRVLKKCGMQFVNETVVDGHPAKTYELNNPFIPL